MNDRTDSVFNVSRRDAAIAGAALGVSLLGFILFIAPHKPTRPGVLIVGERTIQCLDVIARPDGSVVAITSPDRQHIIIKGEWIFVESKP